MHQVFGDEFLRLLEKYYFGEATREERQHILRQLKNSAFARGLWEDVLTTFNEQGLTPHEMPLQVHPVFNRRNALIAAAVLALAFVITFLYYKPTTHALLTRASGNSNTRTIASKQLPVSLRPANGGYLTFSSNGYVLDTNRTPVNVNSLLGKYVKEEYYTANNVLQVPAGATYAIQLPDNTAAYISPVSTLRFPLSFQQDKRRVTLDEGEIYFRVADNGGPPFTIHTIKGDVVARGSFNVRFYDGRLSISSVSGTAAIVNEQGQTMRLQPGEQATCEPGQTQFIKTVYSRDLVLGWLQGKHPFNNATLPAVCRAIERVYNVQVRIDSTSLRDRRLNGILNRSTELETTLNNLCEVGNMRWHIDEQSVVHFN